MGCSLMKKKQRPIHKDSANSELYQSNQEIFNPVLHKQSFDLQQQNCNANMQKQADNNEIRPSMKLLSYLRDKEKKKMEKFKYNSQYIQELFGEDNECIYIKKVDYFTQSVDIYSTFSSPCRRQLVQSENTSLKTVRKKTKENLKNIF